MTLLYLTSLLYLSFGVILLLLGLIILKENLHRNLNRIAGFMMFFAGMGSILAAFGLYMPEGSPLQSSVASFHNLFLLWEFFFPFLLLFSFYFPREHKWISGHRSFPYLIFIPHLIHFVLLVSFDSSQAVKSLIDVGRFNSGFGILLQPILIVFSLLFSLLGLIYTIHEHFFSVVNFFYATFAITFMLLGYRKLQSEKQRRSVRLVLWGIGISMLLYAFAFLFPKMNLFLLPAAASHFMAAMALLVGAGSIAWAIIRYQFLDIRLIIRRGFIYSVVYAILIGLYLLVYGQSKRLVTAVFGIEIPVLEILFIILALFLFQPILGLVETLIDRWLMKDRQDYRHILSEISHEIMTTLDLGQLQEKMIAILKESMGITDSALLVADSDGDLVFERDHNKLIFSGKESWITVARTFREPFGFDDLCLRVEPSRGLDRLRTLNAHLLAPLIHFETLVGILVLSEKEDHVRFTVEDMAVLSILGNQAAVAIENSKLYHENLIKHRMEEELRLAHEIQTNLLPRMCPQSDRFEIAAYNLPSKEIGGDYYDFLPLKENRIGIAIGDISGKGIPAALLMSNLQAALRVSAVQCTHSHEVMALVNNQISQTTSPEKFATFFYGIFDPVRSELEYTNAGHNYPVLCTKHGAYHLLEKGGLIVGILEEISYQSETVRLDAGDLLVLYTDGLTEAINKEDEEFGEERLLHLIREVRNFEAQQVLDLILEEAVNFTGGQLQSDDLTIVVLKMK